MRSERLRAPSEAVTDSQTQPDTLGQEYEAALQAKVDEDLARRTRPGTFIQLIGASVICIALAVLQERPVFAVVSILVMLVLGLYRFYWVYSFGRLYQQDPERWRRHYAIGYYVMPIAWGSFAASLVRLYGSGTPSTIAPMVIGVVGSSTWRGSNAGRNWSTSACSGTSTRV